MIERKKYVWKKPKKEVKKVEPPTETRPSRLTDEILSIVGAERFIRSAVVDHFTYLARKYEGDWDLVGALLHEVAKRTVEDGQLATMDTFSFMNLERTRMTLSLPRAVWKYLYEAHRLEAEGEEDKAILVRHWVLVWRTAAEYDAAQIPTAKKELERLCPLRRRV